MKILIYNFTQPGDPGRNQGGGVAIYHANLLRVLKARGHEVICLGSGERYSILGGTARLSCSKGAYDRASIVNSPAFAPAHFIFDKIETYAHSPGLDGIPASLEAQYGPIDVFHFQNIEGLTAGFFRALRRVFPRARILLSAHNYNLVCPQVNLWRRESFSCTDYLDGHACVTCLPGPRQKRHEFNIRRMEALLRALRVEHTRFARPVVNAVRRSTRAVRWLRSLGRTGKGDAVAATAPLVLTNPSMAAAYAEFRATNAALSTDVFDAVIAVSQRTRQVLADRGIPPASLAVAYIGTNHYRRSLGSPRVTACGAHLQIAYLGHMRRDKGFYFLLEALEGLPDHWARHIGVTVAAAITDYWVIERLRAVGHRFHSITMHDGFTHRTLAAVLKDVHLGVVPVLWEDNLPQVAIEFVSHGIPILTSDRGGGQEIGGDPAFTFPAGNHAAFGQRLRDITTGRLPLAEFWANEPRLFSMEQHVDELMRFYRPGQQGMERATRDYSSPLPLPEGLGEGCGARDVVGVATPPPSLLPQGEEKQRVSYRSMPSA